MPSNGTASGPSPATTPNPKPPPSTTTTLLSTAKAAETTLEHTLSRLIHWDDLAPWRRDNPSIHSGYRPESNSFLLSLQSLFYLHNESVNIWTHLLGAIFFLGAGGWLHALIAPRYESATPADVLIVLLGVGCIIVSWFDHFRTPAWRPYRTLMFVGLGLSGVVPILHALTFSTYRELDERMGLSWVILQGGLYIFGAFLYAVRFPERKYPGTFDIWGSSHQIFHVFVLLAAGAHLIGMAKAFDFHHSVLGAAC
ncbi:hypothetical protein N0V88_003233 [Collariella sp. IMI 366227]|nr:hypothetical protein N0V88_003233 [Collariella sp. IMI 366227]